MRSFLFSLLVMFSAGVVFAQAPAAVPAADVREIDATLTALGDTLTRMDFPAFGKLFTDDCDFVNVVGMHWTGRNEVQKAHAAVFTTRYKHVPQHVLNRTITLLGPGLVLVVSTGKMDDYTAGWEGDDR